MLFYVIERRGSTEFHPISNYNVWKWREYERMLPHLAVDKPCSPQGENETAFEEDFLPDLYINASYAVGREVINLLYTTGLQTYYQDSPLEERLLELLEEIEFFIDMLR